MNLEVSASTAAYVVFALFSSIVIGYTLLSYEPKSRDTWRFITAILVFLVIWSTVWPHQVAPLVDDAWSLDSVGWQGIVLTAGAIGACLSAIGFVLITARQLLS